MYTGRRERRRRHHRKKVSFFEGSKEFRRRIWRTIGSEIGVEFASRFRVPDWDKVLEREAVMRMLQSCCGNVEFFGGDWRESVDDMAAVALP